ncbi:hypothetical protein [Streptomyces lunalinharesii]|uniref:Uncharacterized protein n=1 Tax=Streptomyces lunalinharesii TaxID=333384 RepID=A0ABN3SVY8_9ACTN
MSATWGLGVLQSDDGDRWAQVVIQPDETSEHAELAVRLKSAGCKRLSRREWDGGLWPLSKCSVTVEAGRLTQLHTGRSRILCSEPMPASTRWQAAAERGRVLLALVQPGTLNGVPLDVDVVADAAEPWPGMLDAVSAGRLLGGLAEVRTNAEPYGRRW